MYTPAALLDAVVRTLEEDSSPIIVNTWFGDAKALAITPTTFVIRTTSLLKQEHLKEHYQKNVQEIVTLLYGQPLQPVYVFSDEECAPYIAGEDGMSTGFAKYTFERFIVGPQNKFAHAAAMAVATVDRVTYNPLFIYGDSGLGKTHLLYAIAGETKKRHRVQHGFGIVAGVNDSAGGGIAVVNDIAVGLISAKGKDSDSQHNFISLGCPSAGRCLGSRLQDRR